jgi:hypothetical protein
MSAVSSVPERDSGNGKGIKSRPDAAWYEERL